MAKDFFGNLGETLTRTARGLGDRAGEVYETQKIKNKISGEQKLAEKALADLGRIVYQHYKDGVALEDAQAELCVQIDQHLDKVEELKVSANNIKARKVCPSCGRTLERGAAFCSYCGAACPVVETEDLDEDVVDAEDIEEASEEPVEATEKETEETAAGEAEEVQETSEETEEDKTEESSSEPADPEE